MTRREWLMQNPPPRAAKTIQALLSNLNDQNVRRADIASLRQRWITHKEYWQPRVTIAGEMAQAQQQVNDANVQIAEADKALAASGDVPERMLQLQEELKSAAVCPQHRTDLFRNMNRPEDMFTCENGPHHLFWTRIAGAAKLIVLETLALPSLEFPMTDGTGISRAQWLASHPAPNSAKCPEHPEQVLMPDFEARTDLFTCPQSNEKWLWTPTNGGPQLITVAKVPSLEDPI